MQKYIGSLEGFLERDSGRDEAFWADYQVLGPMFSAVAWGGYRLHQCLCGFQRQPVGRV